MVWGTIVAKVAILLLIGIMLTMLSNVGFSAICFGLAAIFAFLAYYYRKKYERAGDHLELSMKGLRARSTIFTYTGIVQVFYLGYLAMYMFFATHSGTVFKVEPITCNIVQAAWANWANYFMGFVMLWTTYYAKNINIVISSMSLGSWYFDDVDAPSECSSTFSAFKTALTSSAGTISIGSIVTAITSQLLKNVKSKFLVDYSIRLFNETIGRLCGEDDRSFDIIFDDNACIRVKDFSPAQEVAASC